MKYTTSIVSLLTATLIMSGCSDSASSQENSVTTVAGKTTLSRAKVCVDTNNNSVCDINEEFTTTLEDGSYQMQVNEVLAEGSSIIVENGYSNVSLENNTNRFTYVAAYSSDELQQNINTFSTLIHAKMASGMNYDEAKSYIANKYNIDIDLLTEDPIDSVEKDARLLQISYAVEEKYASKKSASSKQRLFFNFFTQPKEEAPAPEPEVVVTEEVVDEVVEEKSYLDFSVDDFLAELDAYYLSLGDYLDELYNEYLGDDNATTSEEPVITEVTRDALNGVWFLENDATPDKLCAEIDAQDNITVYTSSSEDALAIEYDGSITIDLVYGWSTVETFKLSNFTTQGYDVTYSDGTASVVRENSLAECKAKL